MFLPSIFNWILKNKREVFKILFLTQLLLVTLTISYFSAYQMGLVDRNYGTTKMNPFLLILFIIIIIVGITSIYLFRVIVTLIEKESEYELQQLRYQQMLEANELLRSQKHDYLNNLQVIWGMLALGNIEKTKEYLKNLTDDLKIDKLEMSAVEKIDCTHLSTLFLNKIYKCKDLDIDIKYDIDENVTLKEFNPIDLVRIFSNLIDNAIYAVKTLGKDQRKINVSILCQDKELIFEVHNVAPVIPDEIKGKIFEKGFTTKGSEGSGMGLFNVKNLIQKYNGKIQLVSENGIGTRFIIRLPNK